jgi:hypothetical protein
MVPPWGLGTHGGASLRALGLAYYTGPGAPVGSGHFRRPNRLALTAGLAGSRGCPEAGLGADSRTEAEVRNRAMHCLESSEARQSHFRWPWVKGASHSPRSSRPPWGPQQCRYPSAPTARLASGQVARLPGFKAIVASTAPLSWLDACLLQVAPARETSTCGISPPPARRTARRRGRPAGGSGRRRGSPSDGGG